MGIVFGALFELSFDCFYCCLCLFIFAVVGSFALLMSLDGMGQPGFSVSSLVDGHNKHILVTDYFLLHAYIKPSDCMCFLFFFSA